MNWLIYPSLMIDAARSSPFLALGVAIIGFFTLRTIYYITLHPLASYPGPFLCKITTIPSLKHRADGTNHSWPHELHQRYGQIVRIGPNEVSYTHANLWQDIYGKGSDFPKDLVGLGQDVAYPETGLIRSNKNTHVRQRRLFSHAFAERAMRQHEPIVQQYVKLLISKLRERSEAGKTSDLVSMFAFTAFDIMADLSFGEALGMLEKGHMIPWVRDTYASIFMVSLGMAMKSWHPPFGGWFLDFFWGSSKKQREKHNQYSADRVDKRLDNPQQQDRDDIWGMVMKHAEKWEGGLSRKEMYSNAATFMLGGTETTTAAASALAFCLCRDPDRKKKFLAEVRSLATAENLTFAKLQPMRYLNACIDEAMRLYPPAPTPMPRLVPKGGRMVCGKWLPEGARVDVALFAAFRSPHHFTDPDDFVPERWLPECPPRYANDNRGVSKPFSYGPRDCVGKNLAWHEQRILQASLWWHFDVELEDPSFDWLDQRSYGIWQKHPLNVKLKLVKR